MPELRLDPAPASAPAAPPEPAAAADWRHWQRQLPAALPLAVARLACCLTTKPRQTLAAGTQKPLLLYLHQLWMTAGGLRLMQMLPQGQRGLL